MEPAKASPTKAALVLAVFLLPLGLLLDALLGPVLAIAACGLLAAALALTVLAEGGADTTSWDAETGLPDRADAVRRLDRMLAQRHVPSRQGAVIVASIAAADPEAMEAEERRAVQLLVMFRLSQGLRRGDRIIRLGENALGAILGPSRGLDARSVRTILDRIDDAFREPVRIGPASPEAQVSLGACLQHDAPGPDAHSWLAAAEQAAEIAREAREPHVYWRAAVSGPARWEAAEPAEEEPRRSSA